MSAKTPFIPRLPLASLNAEQSASKENKDKSGKAKRVLAEKAAADADAPKAGTPSKVLRSGKRIAATPATKRKPSRASRVPVDESGAAVQPPRMALSSAAGASSDRSDKPPSSKSAAASGEAAELVDTPDSQAGKSANQSSAAQRVSAQVVSTPAASPPPQSAEPAAALAPGGTDALVLLSDRSQTAEIEAAPMKAALPLSELLQEIKQAQKEVLLEKATPLPAPEPAPFEAVASLGHFTEGTELGSTLTEVPVSEAPGAAQPPLDLQEIMSMQEEVSQESTGVNAGNVTTNVAAAAPVAGTTGAGQHATVQGTDNAQADAPAVEDPPKSARVSISIPPLSSIPESAFAEETPVQAEEGWLLLSPVTICTSPTGSPSSGIAAKAETGAEAQQLPVAEGDAAVAAATGPPSAFPPSLENADNCKQVLQSAGAGGPKHIPQPDWVGGLSPAASSAATNTPQQDSAAGAAQDTPAPATAPEEAGPAVAAKQPSAAAKEQDGTSLNQGAAPAAVVIPMDAPAPEPGTGERLSADFLPRPQTTESYMDRKLRTLQQAEWTAQDGALKPHKSKLMLEKEAVLSARVDELSDADKALCRRMVQQAIQKAIITEGKGLDETIIIHKSRLEREKEAAAALRKAGRPTSARKRPVPGASSAPGQGLGAVMTKPTSKLQREGDAAAASRAAQGKAVPSYMRSTAASAGIKQPGLGETLVKHQSKLEKEKEAARAAAMPGTATPAAAPKRPRLSSGFAGSSLGDMKVHKSRLEKDKENAVKQAGAAGLAPAATKVTAKTPARTAAAAAAQEPGLSAMKVHKSRVEREKEAWARAAARNAPAVAPRPATASAATATSSASAPATAVWPATAGAGSAARSAAAAAAGQRPAGGTARLGAAKSSTASGKTGASRPATAVGRATAPALARSAAAPGARPTTAKQAAAKADGPAPAKAAPSAKAPAALANAEAQAAKAAAPNSAAKAGGRTLAAPVSAADFLKSAGKPRRTSLDRTGSGGKPLERSSSAGRRASGAGATCSQGPHTPLTAEQMQPV